ncbi:MAG: multi-sensor signal transduction histidine kinase [Bradyrhizobium sp.]|jgi:hypothetical protein|nr:multi-sensor signal transduction histidine kinase [Bradyrhizobium sp.]
MMSGDTTALLSRHGSLQEEIANHVDDLSRLISCDGFAVLRGKELLLTGTCPPEEDVRTLADWLIAKSVESVFSTNRLIVSYPAAEEFQGVAAGVLTVLLSVEERWLLVWFRAEEVQIVKWAGNPHEAVELKSGETLSPRSSFEAWQETVPGHSKKDRPREGGFWIVYRELVLKLRHGLQFILGGVVHRVIGIPTRTGAGCGGCCGCRCGTGGGSRGAVWSGGSCRSIRRCGRC